MVRAKPQLYEQKGIVMKPYVKVVQAKGNYGTLKACMHTWTHT